MLYALLSILFMSFSSIYLPTYLSMRMCVHMCMCVRVHARLCVCVIGYVFLYFFLSSNDSYKLLLK